MGWMMSLWYGFAIEMVVVFYEKIIEETLRHGIIQMYKFFFEMWYATCN
jgi:hypothetical protein